MSDPEWPNPELGIVVPAFNMERWVGETIDSVLAQGLEVQLVVVDDASTDRTAELAREAIGQHRGCELVANDRGKGLSSARNAGLRRLRTPWVMFLDADDLLLPGALRALLDARRNGQPAVLGGFSSVDEAGRPIPPGWELDRSRSLERLGHPAAVDLVALARHNVIPPPGAQILSVEALRQVGGYDQDLLRSGGSEDLELLCRLAALGELTQLERPVLAYRVREGSLSRSRNVQSRRVRWRLAMVRRAPRRQRIAMGWAFAARYAELALERIGDGLRHRRARRLLVGLGDLAIAAAFLLAGLVAACLPAWRPSWEL